MLRRLVKFNRFFSTEIPRSGKRERNPGSLKMGIYAGGRLVPTWKEDPQEWIVCFIIVGITFYGIMNLSTGETYPEMRRRLIRERVRQEYHLPEGWDDEIEGTSPILT
jgi:hypothetical protein